MRQCLDGGAFGLRVPGTAVLRDYGFTVNFEIKPREWETTEILKVVYHSPRNRPRRTVPAIHFPVILDYI